VSTTEVNRAVHPTWAHRIPYSIALIELEEGPVIPAIGIGEPVGPDIGELVQLRPGLWHGDLITVAGPLEDLGRA
jgi:hypothetical protein